MSMANGPRDNDESNEATRAVTEAAGNRVASDQVEEITRIVLNVAKKLQEREEQEGAFKHFKQALTWFVASWAFVAFLASAIFVGVGLVRKDVSPWRVVEEAVVPYSAAEAKEEMVNRHLKLGTSLLNIGQPEAAKTEFEHVLRLDPNNAEAAWGVLKSDLYIPIVEQNYNLEVQEQRVQFLLDERPHDSHGKAFLGAMLMGANPEQALRRYREAVRINDSNAEAYFGMGNIYEAHGELGKALEMYQAARKEAKWNPKYKHAIAYVTYRNKEYQKARAEYSSLLALDPQYLWAYPDIALTYQVLGDLEMANSYQRKFMSLLENREIASMEKNQGTLAFHTQAGPIYLSEPSQKLFYAYYNVALTSYLLNNEKDANRYVQAAQDQRLDIDAKKAVEQIVEDDINTLLSTQPDLEPKTDKFRNKFMNSGEAAFAEKGATQAVDSSRPKGERQDVYVAIRNHYEAIGEQDFEEAYAYFGPTQRNLVDQDAWMNAEKSYDIEDSTIHSLSVGEVRENTATAVIDVSFKDKTGTPRFLITWNLIKEDEEWKLNEQLSGERLQ